LFREKNLLHSHTSDKNSSTQFCHKDFILQRLPGQEKPRRSGKTAQKPTNQKKIIKQHFCEKERLTILYKKKQILMSGKTTAQN